MDSFALSLKAELLWRRDQPKPAIETMLTVVKLQPDNASFLFRIGRFFHQLGLSQEAYEYFTRAKRSDPTYLDVRMSLASVAIDLNKMSEAQKEIEDLRGKGSAEKRYILDGIEAQFWLAKRDVEKASEFASRALGHRRNPTTLGMMARVEAARYEQTVAGGMTTLAETLRFKAILLIEEGLKIEKNNGALLRQARRLGMDVPVDVIDTDFGDIVTPTADLEPDIPSSDFANLP